MLIHPEIFTTPDFPTVKFREARDKINLDIELPKILHSQGWGLGTYFHVQFIEHDRSKLFSSGLFLVTEDVESLVTANLDSYSPTTKMIMKRKAELVGKWFVPIAVKESFEKEVTRIEDEIAEKQAAESLPDLVVKWNLGKKVHEVKRGDEVLFFSRDKEDAIRFKEAA